MTEFITQGKTLELYRALSKDFAYSKYHQYSDHKGFGYFYSGSLRALVYNNEILSIANIRTNEVYTVFGAVLPEVYYVWIRTLMFVMNIDIAPTEHFVGLEEPSKLRK